MKWHTMSIVSNNGMQSSSVVNLTVVLQHEISLSFTTLLDAKEVLKTMQRCGANFYALVLVVVLTSICVDEVINLCWKLSALVVNFKALSCLQARKHYCHVNSNIHMPMYNVYVFIKVE